MKEFGLYISGEWRKARTGKTFQSIDPAQEEAWATFESAGAEDVDDAVASARDAYRNSGWKEKSPAERGEVLKQVAMAVFERQDELAAAEVRDGGGTITKGTMMDVPGAAMTFQYYGELISSPEYAASLEQEFQEEVPVPSRNIVRREPIGICAGIVPWNFPLIMAAWKVAPAIAAGNSVVLKPASFTPSTALMLAEICTNAGVPAGVVNAISGPGGSCGEALASHPDISKIAFTGSTEIGRRMMQLGASTVKKVTLELGGKSPNIILDDADLDLAVAGALYGTFMHQGQICESGTRVLVPESIYDEFVERMVEGTRRIHIGDPMDPGTTMGPVVSRSQLETVEKYVALGTEQGARCVAGGKRPEGRDKGFYYEPTIFADVDNSMRIAQEEIFGPVVSVIPYKDEAHALSIANDSMYGLGGAVFSSDEERAVNVARQIETGTVWINDYHLINVKYPFGGYKQSGVGRELGPWGLSEYQQVKHIHVGQATSVADKMYFMTLLR
jgi:acyl-CoA reductase-like NAD-dependent aldehyde dehydrogenase